MKRTIKVRNSRPEWVIWVCLWSSTKGKALLVQFSIKLKQLEQSWSFIGFAATFIVFLYEFRSSDSMASPFTPPLLFPINHLGNKESASSATKSSPTDDFPHMPLSFSTQPDPPAPPLHGNSSLYNSCQVSFNVPPPPPICVPPLTAQ